MSGPSTAVCTDRPTGTARRHRRGRGAAHILALALLAGLLVAPAVPAAADGCFPAGGARMPDPPGATGDVVFDGHGWGHGIGMSQWGAQGAATLGCSVSDILTTYYPGVDIGTAEMPSEIRVGLVPDRSGGALVNSYDVTTTAGEVDWTLYDADPATGEVLPLTATQPAGSTWRVALADDGSYVVRDAGVPLPEPPTEPTGGADPPPGGGPDDDGDDPATGGQDDPGERLAGGDGVSALVADLDGATVTLPAEGHVYRRGNLEFFPASAAGGADDELFVTLEIGSTDELPAMDAYLYGLAEVPSSWEPAALEAQAVVGRSYALAQHRAYRGDRPGCRCDLYDSTASQHYTAWDKEGETRWGTRWVAAVDATSSRIMSSGGTVAVGFYNSSHGGHSESNAFVWGGPQLDWIAPVDDSRWDLASGNPNAAWSVGFTVDEISGMLAAAGIDVGRVQAISLPEPRGASGRVGDPARGAGGALIQGTEATVRISGPELRRALGLRSTLVTVTTKLACVAPPEVDLEALRPVRSSGPDRVATAVALSQALWPDGAPSAVIAAAGNFPDALAGGPLAAQRDVPLLLTGSEALAPSVAAEIERLGVERVTVLGGRAALSDRVIDDLAELLAGGVAAVDRIAGDDRWSTAADIAGTVGAPADKRVLLALGGHPDPSRAWPDAVASGALQAGGAPVPLLLTAPDALPQATRDALTDLRDRGVADVWIVGGTAAVSEEVEQSVADLGLRVDRLAGADRFATSAAVAQAAVDRGAGAAELIVARADAYPDALSAAPVAARTDAPLLLVDSCDLARRPATVAWLDGRPPLSAVRLVGGTAALSERVRWQLDERMDADA